MYILLDEERKKIYNINLQFFAGSEEKTEEPTQKKREESKKEGQNAHSIEISTAAAIIFMFLALKIFAPSMFKGILAMFNHHYSLFTSVDEMFTVPYMTKYISDVYLNFLIMLLPLLIVAMVVGVVTTIIQIGFTFNMKLIMPKWHKINPFEGIKNKMFSKRAFVELIKSIIKLVLITTVIYLSLQKEAASVVSILNMTIMDSTNYIGNLAVDLAIKVGMFFIIIAAMDYGYQRFEFEKSIKMSKQEVKQEYKESEGNPEIKGKIKQKMQQLSMRRMMQDVKSADVIITNPTHYAVAVKYDLINGGAPMVIAKGTDFMAQKIKEIAKENDIYIMENKPLARTLYAVVDVGQDIPEELYAAVAEVLAFVYKLKNKI